MNTNKATLVMHGKGGWEATADEIEAVPVPDRTPTYTPIPHVAVVEQIRALLPKHAMKLARMQFGLARNGEQMFGVADVVNGDGQPDWGVAIGFRNSYNRTLSLTLCAGSRVFVCDNLAFHAEVVMRERHVGKLDVGLPMMVDELITRTAAFKEHVAYRIERLKEIRLKDESAHDLICDAVRKEIVAGEMVPRLLKEWHEPSHEEFAPRTAWSLFNGFTQVNQTRSAQKQMATTLKLTALFDTLN